MTVMVELDIFNKTLINLVQNHLDNVVFPEKVRGYKNAERILREIEEDIDDCISIDELLECVTNVATHFDSFNNLLLSEKVKVIQSYIKETQGRYKMVDTETSTELEIDQITFNLVTPGYDFIGKIVNITIEADELKFLVHKKSDAEPETYGCNYNEEIFVKFLYVEDMTPSFLNFTIDNCKE